MKNADALAIMLKAPEPGSCKTRLAPPLTYEQAAGLYRCFLTDIFNKASRMDSVDVYAAYTPEDAGGKFHGIIPEDIETFAQEGLSLGERMHNIFKYLLQKGHKKVVIIGSDSPDLPEGYIKEAFRLLGEEAGIVLGPAIDGGYYLIAMNRLFEAPFNGIPWSTGVVLEETLKRLGDEGIAFRLLEPWHDIDTIDDLSLFKGGNAPATSEFLKTLKKITQLIEK